MITDSQDIRNRVCMILGFDDGWKERQSRFITHKDIDDIMALITQRETALLEELELNVGSMRQWLNEDRIDDPKKMVTSAELKVWLKALSKIKKEIT